MDLAHLHLMLNHVPVIGVVFGFTILLAGIIFRSKPVSGVGLGILVFSALVAIPVYLTGETAEEVVENMPGVSESVISQHETAAGFSLVLVIASGVFAGAALFFSRLRASRVNGLLVVGTLLLSLVTGTSLLRTANLGGQVRHTEIRGGGQAPAGTTTDTTDKRGVQDHDDDD